MNITDVGLLINFFGAALLGASSQFGSAVGWGGVIGWKTRLWRWINASGWLLLALGFVTQLFAKHLEKLIS